MKDTFFKLIRRTGRANLELAWQIALGFKENGDQYFIDFTSLALQFSSVNKYYNDNPINFLEDIAIGTIKLNKSIETDVAKNLYTITQLITTVKIIYPLDSQLPIGTELFPEIQTLVIYTNLPNIAKGIHKIENLKNLEIFFENDIRISSDLGKCKNLKSFSISSENGSFAAFPENFNNLLSLKNLEIRVPFSGFFLKDLSIESLVLNVCSEKDFELENIVLKRIFTHDKLPNSLLELSIHTDKSEDSMNLLEQNIQILENLEMLIIWNSEKLNFGGIYNFLKNLNSIFISDLNSENIHFFAELKNLKTIESYSISNAKNLENILTQKGSKAVIKEISIF